MRALRGSRSTTAAELEYDRLLLTTGAEPRRIPFPGASSTASTTCGRSPTATCSARRLDDSARVAVVGAGWIGSEFAASARQRGLDVTVIDPLALPNERIFGPEIGAFYRDVHVQHGVEMLLGQGVEAFEGDGAVARVRTSGGKVVECDFAVVGIGIVPRTQLAADAGIEVDNGIVVNERLETLGAGRVRRRRRRQRLASVLRAAHPGRALGQRAQPGARGGAGDARRRTSATTGSRTSSPTSTTSAWSTRGTRRAGTRSCSAATATAASSSPSG